MKLKTAVNQIMSWEDQRKTWSKNNRRHKRKDKRHGTDPGLPKNRDG